MDVLLGGLAGAVQQFGTGGFPDASCNQLIATAQHPVERALACGLALLCAVGGGHQTGTPASRSFRTLATAAMSASRFDRLAPFRGRFDVMDLNNSGVDLAGAVVDFGAPVRWLLAMGSLM